MLQTVAAVLTSGERQSLATYFADLDTDMPMRSNSTKEASEEKEASIARGREIVEKGIPAKKVPSCIDCHGPGESKVSNRYPLLAGQPASCIQQRLKLFRDNQRGGGPPANLMQPVANGLPEESCQDVARYYESLTAE